MLPARWGGGGAPSFALGIEGFCVSGAWLNRAAAGGRVALERAGAYAGHTKTEIVVDIICCFSAATVQTCASGCWASAAVQNFCKRLLSIAQLGLA